MNTPVDVDAQCLVDDREGMYFLCPAYKRDEALAYFEHHYESMAEDDWVPQPFPKYLVPVTSVENLTFYNPSVK